METMTVQDGFFKTREGSSIYYQAWRPQERAKAVLMIVHGLAEHGGRYMNLVNHFVPKGFCVYAVDHPGHGKSDGARGFVHRFEEFMEPLIRCRDMIQEQDPDLPVFLVGHSMGGLIATLFLARHQKRFRGAVISGPSIKVPDSVPRSKVLAGKILSRFIPKAGIMPLDHEGISRDPAVVLAYKNDPLVFTGSITARLAAELMTAMEKVPDLAPQITLPLLIIHGGADRMVDPASATLLHALAGSPDKRLNILDGLYHEVFNEPEHPAVLLEMENWIKIRM